MTKAHQRISTNYPGVRYRESPTRKIKGRPERYFIIRYKKHGKAIEEAVGWESERVTVQYANSKRAEIIHAIRTGKGPQSLAEMRGITDKRKREEKAVELAEIQENVSLDEVGREFFKWAKEHRKSWKNELSRYANHIADGIGQQPMKDIATIHLEGLKRDLIKKGLADTSVRHVMVLIRQIYNWAIGRKLFFGANPVVETSRNHKSFLKTKDNDRLRFLSFEEAKLLLEELKKRSVQVHDIALCSLHTGMRAGEIFNLTWRDIDFQHGLIFIKDPKGTVNREAYITPPLKEVLQNRCPPKQNSAGYIFKNLNGEKIKEVSNAFDRVVDKLGFNAGVTDRRDKFVFHSLRHTFASWLALQGETLLTIKELMGHKSIAMTERYAKLTQSLKQKAVLKLSELQNDKIVKLESLEDTK